MVETLVERGVGLVGCQKVVHPQVKQLLRRKVRTLEERERGLEGRRRERGRIGGKEEGEREDWREGGGREGGLEGRRRERGRIGGKEEGEREDWREGGGREGGLEGRRRERGRLESPSTVACCQTRRMTRPLPLSSSPLVF